MQTSQLNPKIAPPKPAAKIPLTFKVFGEFSAVEARPERWPRIANRIGLQSIISALSRTYCDDGRVHLANSSSNALASFRSSVSKPSVNQP
jgi:hypothetical protein